MVYVVADGGSASAIRAGLNANFTSLFAKTDTMRINASSSNFFFGQAGNDTMTGGGNVGGGNLTMSSATTMTDCTGLGDRNLKNATTVVGATAIGKFSQESTVTGGNGTSVGDSTLRACLAALNTAMGYTTASGVINGTRGLWIGAGAAQTVEQGDDQCIGGYGAAFTGANAARNSLWGSLAKYFGSGNEDSGIGYYVLANSTGGRNFGGGAYAGFTNITGTRNIWIGESAGNDAINQASNLTNSIGIGALSYTTRSNQVVLGSGSVVETNLRGKTVINSTLIAPRSWLDVRGDNTAFLFGASGLTHGIRINATTGELQIQAVDETLNAAYKPMVFKASALNFDGGTAIVKQTHAAVATDLTTAITRINTLCTQLTNYGLHN